MWAGRKLTPECASKTVLDAFWERCRRRYRVALVRNGDWLQRRYLSCPGADYHFVSVSRGGDMAAWAIVRIAQDRLNWVDLLWDGDREEAVMGLEEKIVRFARQHRVLEMALGLMGDAEAERVLGTRGWRERPHPLNLHLTDVPFLPEISGAYVLKHFYATMGDSDLV